MSAESHRLKQQSLQVVQQQQQRRLAHAKLANKLPQDVTIVNCEPQMQLQLSPPPQLLVSEDCFCIKSKCFELKTKFIRSFPRLSARVWRLSAWFALNLLIFVVCYLNYVFQRKHRYLYKLLSAGLCFSRAAAMIININLLLVWLPMCKYSLTKLAFVATTRLSALKAEFKYAQSTPQIQPKLPKNNIMANENKQHFFCDHSTSSSSSSFLLSERLKLSYKSAMRQIRVCLLNLKVGSLHCFVLAADNCKYLHFVCATTISIASVIHTVAHLINVINFSKNYEQNLGSLNMATHRGQNPLHLIASVPGVTGFLMLLILLLMSLSSTDIIRNSRYDLFHLLHRLSIFFVVLLFLHPSSHVLKEQANIDRHNPDVCFERLISQQNKNITIAKQTLHRIQQQPSTSTTEANRSNQTSTTTLEGNNECADLRPKFVSQCSISWYLLSAGLTCYVIDLLFRKHIRSKNSIELLNARCDKEGNLLELTLSANHKRFSRWMPGQFVYLNCPQISQFEWHPFTISSMGSSELTLHIKTGGDWTRKLRNSLQFNAASSVKCINEELKVRDCNSSIFARCNVSAADLPLLSSSIKCTKLVVGICRESVDETQHQQQFTSVPATVKNNKINNIECNVAKEDNVTSADVNIPRLKLYLDGPFHSPFERLLEQRVSVCISNGVGWTAFSPAFKQIAASQRQNSDDESLTLESRNLSWWLSLSGEGADDKSNKDSAEEDNRRRSRRLSLVNATTYKLNKEPKNISNNFKLSNNKQQQETTNLHLIVIVTSVEQLLPFYRLATSYLALGLSSEPVREMCVYLTRAKPDDEAVRQFCDCEQLVLVAPNGREDRETPFILVTEMFRIFFKRPNFDEYLSKFKHAYPTDKISVYCCGSKQVKRDIRELCNKLNKLRNDDVNTPSQGARFTYHEEDF